MKDGYHNDAEKAVMGKIQPVESEQGAPKDVGSEPPPNFGHGSMKSEGVGKSIPPEA